VSIATGPEAPKTHWEQLYLPALEPIALPAGAKLSVRLRSTTSFKKGTNVQWTLLAHDGRGMEIAQQALDLEKGFVP
jgi:protein arginine N-methyltransferase 1